MQVRNKRQGSRINAILQIKRININAILHIKRINILSVFCDETFYSNRSANDTTNVLFYKSMVDASSSTAQQMEGPNKLKLGLHMQVHQRGITTIF